MAVKSIPVVFITANVGSIFEEPAVMLKIWTQEFLSTIARLDPKFIALHCQEVGGKNYEKSMQHVEHFVQLLVESEELRLFDKIRVFLDEDYSSAENFTALGNFYFIHESITDALIYDFETKTFEEVLGKEVYSKNIELIPTKQKSKFPLQYFPECKWSRKGFLRTRWSLSGVVFDLVNIHLFHDASNFVAIKSFPSIYSDTRRRALAYTLERFQTDEYGSVPLFLFGDFNFRADTKGVVKLLSEGLNCSTLEGEVSVLEFKKEDKVILSLGKKEFSHSDHQTLFSAKEGNWLREFDKELDAFADELFEFSISFPPSYPFEENSSGDKCYMKTRCPAWCDRVILSRSAIPLVRDTTAPGNVEYGLMGRETCMGDHKPVYLKIYIKGSTEKETCPEPDTARELPKLNAKQTVSNALPKENERNHCSDKNDSGKLHGSPGLNISEKDYSKLACSFEALISQNMGLTRDEEESIEPDLSRCSTCRTHKHASKVVDNPGGEQVSNATFQDDYDKIIEMLACEIKVPESALKNLELNDTGQKLEEAEFKFSQFKKLESEKEERDLDRYSSVKRVNSASLVENKPKKEDWKNSRCNSDVSWNPCNAINHQSPEVARIWGINKSFNRGNSRIRLISSSNSLNESLPRLTSHHSSSDEEWFEKVVENDDNVSEVSCDEITDKRKLSNASNDLVGIQRETSSVNECGDQLPPSHHSCSEPSSSKATLGEKVQTVFTDAPDLRDYEREKQETDKIEVGNKSDKASEMKKKFKSDSEVFASDAKSPEKKSVPKTFSILKRLTEGRNQSSNNVLTNGRKVNAAENKESFENLFIDPSATQTEETELKSEELNELNAERNKFSDKIITPDPYIVEGKNNKQLVTGGLISKDSIESWETIELTDKKQKHGETVNTELISDVKKKKKYRRIKCKSSRPNWCCTLQ